MTLRHLHIVADDAGLHPGTDAAILACARAGTLGAAAVVAGGPTAARFVAAARRLDLELGLHLDLTEGRPLGGALAGLTDREGRWPGGKDALAAAPDAAVAALAAEVRRQWRRLVHLGARPTFVNGHNHVHVLPTVARALARALDAPGGLCRRTGWVRVPRCPEPLPDDLVEVVTPAHLTTLEQVTQAFRHPDAFVGMRTAATGGREALDAELAGVPAEASWVEWMVHPGARPGTAFTEHAARDAEACLLGEPATLDACLATHGFVRTRHAP